MNFPDEKHDKIFWKSRAKTEKYPFVIYADFESCLVPVNTERAEGVTQVISEHIPSGFCTYTVCNFGDYNTEPVLYSGPDTMNVFTIILTQNVGAFPVYSVEMWI